MMEKGAGPVELVKLTDEVTEGLVYDDCLAEYTNLNAELKLLIARGRQTDEEARWTTERGGGQKSRT